MKKVKLIFDFGEGPIWNEYFDEKSLKTTTGIDEIDNNKDIQKLNQELQDIYSSYYEQDSHDMPMWFNKEKQIKDKEEVLKKLSLLKEMIYSATNHQVEIEDEASKEYEEL